MTDQPQLFPPPEAIQPPKHCPQCGGPIVRNGFAHAECDRGCGYEWRRSSQLASNEPWPGEPF